MAFHYRTSNELPGLFARTLSVVKPSTSVRDGGRRLTHMTARNPPVTEVLEMPVARNSDIPLNLLSFFGLPRFILFACLI